MTISIRRFIYVHNPVHHQEESYFPPANTLRREDFIWLIAKAANLHPLGFALAQFVWLHHGNLSVLAARFQLPSQELEHHLNAFFTTLDQLSSAEESQPDEQT